MHIDKLDVSGLRNLKASRLQFSPELNLIVGENGSGKTSLLEAIYLMGRGRSFRTTHLNSVINKDHHTCIVSGQLLDQGRSVQIGVARQGEGLFKFRINRKPVSASSELAAMLPLLLINADSFNLLDGGPNNRRRYLDWILFHVEQSYQVSLKALKRILKQRNSLLRRGKINNAELGYWDDEFCLIAGQIHALRAALFKALAPKLSLAVKALDGVGDVEYKYIPGWDPDKPLKEQLLQSRSSELKQGRTLVGPQCADIKMYVHGRPAKEVLSRGQSKILVSAMSLVQAQMLSEVSSKSPVALVDDLPAELDVRHRALMIDALLGSGAQVFITGIGLDSLLGKDLKLKHGESNIKVFHVEQGKVKQQTGL